MQNLAVKKFVKSYYLYCPTPAWWNHKSLSRLWYLHSVAQECVSYAVHFLGMRTGKSLVGHNDIFITFFLREDQNLLHMSFPVVISAEKPDNNNCRSS